MSKNDTLKNAGNPGSLYLLPSCISEADHRQYLPGNHLEIIKKTKFFFVENIRSARRFISSLNLNLAIDQLEFLILNNDSEPESLKRMTRILLEGNDAIVLSEAGSPGVADPGANLVLAAHRHKIRVIPLTGPSSILLALMASGFNGQNFAFNGYLPIDEKERIKKIRELETKMLSEHQTQIFMETPYRNDKLFSSLMRSLRPDTLLCIAAGITGAAESIKTLPVKDWKKAPVSFNKIPAMFLIYHNS
jgi:16S rRNA (cytidine1402-2'-O)-methyltransferase